MKRILTNILYTVIALVLGLLLLVPSDETQEPQKNSEQSHSVTLMDKTAGQVDAPGVVAKEENVSQKIAEQLNFPALTGRVVDQAGILSPAVKEELESTLAAHENNTTNQVVVVTIKTLGGVNISEYSLKLGRYWGIGQKDKNNGVLLVVAPNDRQVRIEVGYGLEGTITDAFSEVIIDNYIVPEFKKDDIEGGIKIGTQKILALLEGDEVVRKDIEKLSEFPIEGYVMLFSALLIFARNMFGIIGQVCAIIGVSAFTGGAISLWVAPRLGIEDFAARGGITAALSAILLGIALRNILAKNKSDAGDEGIEKSDYEGPDGDDGDNRGFRGGGGSFGGGGASGKW
ncbi:TPM domain-containing protein [uncultured Campylobacter sp.]|uniref:TPM domain-containing protein n=1 Tax=uncultured Campylobacter sp. TaxID=218934 RepID=UPI002632B662|nr:TPM domain-containing protein [uncultured Campylobacter sp.]